MLFLQRSCGSSRGSYARPTETWNETGVPWRDKRDNLYVAVLGSGGGSLKGQKSPMEEAYLSSPA